MDNSPTSTINFGRTEPEPMRVEPQAAPDKKKPLFIVSLILSAAIILCFMAVIIVEIAYRVGVPMPGGPENGISYVSQTVLTDDIHRGDLILVKEGYEYVFPNADDSNIVSVVANKNNSYLANAKAQLDADTVDKINEMMAAMKEETGFSNVSVHEGYRTYEKQSYYYDDLKLKDEVAAGFSEHHTGTAVDLKIVDPKTDLTYALTDNDDAYTWLMANCYKYGFIDRYPDEKVEITGVDHDWNTNPPSTHLRYVGYAHAYYMYENDLCLEEYLELIRTNYSYEGEHLTFTADDGNAYEIYYFEAEGEEIELPVPEDYEYSISGDNMNGFIVTVCFGEANG